MPPAHGTDQVDDGKPERVVSREMSKFMRQHGTTLRRLEALLEIRWYGNGRTKRSEGHRTPQPTPGEPPDPREPERRWQSGAS